jgi:hypothetical protein
MLSKLRFNAEMVAKISWGLVGCTKKRRTQPENLTILVSSH